MCQLLWRAPTFFFSRAGMKHSVLATIEAAACGLPVVATSINGTEDFIQPGINGDFVKSDPKHIAEVIEPLIKIRKRQEMGRNAQQLVEKNYTWDRVTEQTESAYQEYLGSQSSKGVEDASSCRQSPLHYADQPADLCRIGTANRLEDLVDHSRSVEG